MPHPRQGPRFVAALALLVAACSGLSPLASGEGASPSPSENPIDESAVPSVSPSVPPASVSFAFGADPVITRALAGSDALYVNPGAVIEDTATLHMYPNLFSTWPGHIDVPHLVSMDGEVWTLASAAAALTSDEVPFAASGADVSTGFIAPDGTWVLVFETIDISRPWVLGRATAPGPDGPWTVDPEPILAPGPAGSWDAGGVSWPSVVMTDAGLAMYYAGIDRPRGKSAIGLATSADGRTWTKHDGPVFETKPKWELGKLDRPRVVVTPRGLAMVYATGRLTDRAVAWSDDGISWQRDGDGPVIDQGRFPVSGRAWDAALLYRDGWLLYYLEIGAPSGSEGTSVYLARASLP